MENMRAAQYCRGVKLISRKIIDALMPDGIIDAEITDKRIEVDFNRIAQILEEKWPEPRKCPICSNENWDISNRIFTLRGVFKLSEAYPVVAVTCTNCGFSRFFNLIVLGILKPDE